MAASLLALPAAAIVGAYAADRAGVTIAPFALLPLALLLAGALFRTLRRRADPDAPGVTAFSVLVLSVFAWLMWLARPQMLPLGGGPDFTHHLQLVNYIQQHWRLVHDPALAPYLGEMIDYTAGSHLLAAILAAWLKTDGLHVVHAVLAFAVALKMGVVFLIARRLLRPESPREPLALVAALLLFLAPAYLIESFTRHFFYAQVVGELFAVGMWWALTLWDQRPSTPAAALFAMSGAAAFLTWPVWVGPPLVAWSIVVARRGDLPWPARLTHLVVALCPIAAVAIIHTAGRTGAIAIAGTGGFVEPPTMNAVRWALVVIGGVGLLRAPAGTAARATLLFAGALVLQSAALFAVARASGADTPYLALKMFYLAPYPIAVGASLAIGRMWTAVVPARSRHLAWAMPAVLALAIVGSIARAPRPRPFISQELYEAGAWARSNLPAGCVDYFTEDSNAAYWLHVAVLGNPRASARTGDTDTFEQPAATVRWILPGGLPYAIAEDVAALPRDVRTNVDVLAQFGPAAVFKRRGRASCADASS